MTVDGVDLLVFLVCSALLFGVYEVWRWCAWNEQRKDERLVQRNLRRAGL